jgi:hypothetical protein
MKKTNAKVNAQRPHAYRADIEVPATEKINGRLVHVDLTEQETAKIQRFADRAGMTLDAFIREWVGPGDRLVPWRKRGTLRVRIDHVRFATGMLKTDKARLERAAKHDKVCVERFVADAVASSIEGAEDDMIVHPKSKEPIGSAREANSLLRRNEEHTAELMKGGAL